MITTRCRGSRWSTFAGMAALVLSVAAHAQQLPQGGTELLGAGMASFELNNFAGDAERATMESVAVKGQPFENALRIDSTARSEFWHAAVTTGAFDALKRGDVCLLQFYVRTLRSEQEDGNGTVTAFVQHNDRPYNPSLMETVTFGTEWTRIDLPFEVLQSYPADNDQLTLGVGGAVQAIEIGGITLKRFPAGTEVRDLPVYRITYAGRAEDAAWRAEAIARIDATRKAPLTVKVVDAQGQPVAGAQVRVAMQRHAFGFGTTVSVPLLFEDGEDAMRYRQQVERHFNVVSTENALKWGRWNDPEKREQALDGLRWMKDRGLEVHGHVLVWPSWGKSRVDLTAERAAAEAGDGEPLRRRIETHLEDLATSTAGLVDEWDVMNEPWNNHDFMDILGQEVMIDWFRQAQQHAPDARRFINDFGILTVGAKETDGHQDHYFETIQYLLENDAPLDAIGMQGHFGTGGLTPPDRLLRILDRFAVFNKPIMITEYDLFTQDEQLQADYTRDLLIAAFSHPSVEGVLIWGFWDGAHWRGNAPMFRRDWSLKPAGQVWLDLVKRDWWTNEVVTTDANGVARLRGFQGDYHLTLKQAGSSVEAQAITLDGEGTTVTLTVDAARP